MDDNEIVRLLWLRDESGLTALTKKYGSYCRAVAKNILRNPTDAEDCLNDAYMKIWNSIPPAMPRILSAFIAKITKNTALDMYAANHAAKRGGGELPLSFEELDDFVSGNSSPELNAEHKEMLAAINRFLATLSPDNRLLFVNRYWYYYSVSELAVAYEMTERAVVTSLSRTRKKLKEYLRKRGFEI